MSDKAAERQKGAALILGLFWITALATAYLIFEPGPHPPLVLISFAIMIFGLITLFEIRVHVPFNFLSKEDLSKYNKEKVGLVLGIPSVLLSCVFLFFTMNFIVMFVVSVVVAITICMGAFCVYCMKSFKADTWPKY